MSFNLLKFKKNQKTDLVMQEIKIDVLLVGFDLNSMYQLTQEPEFLSKSFIVLDHNERSVEENIYLADQLPYPWVYEKSLPGPSSEQYRVDDCKFYKDGEFRSFQGRHKVNQCHPYLLKFSSPSYKVKWSWWWDNKLSSPQRDKLNSSLMLGQVKEVFFKNDVWEIHTYDHKIIKASKIQWNNSPEQFLKLFKCQTQFPKNFLSWCSSFESLNLLLVQIQLHPQLLNNVDRALIPLTMGTDEGYFLLSKDITSENSMNCNMLYVFKESDLQEEDVANKIRLIKKQMMKIFNLNDSLFKDERVFFLPQFTFVTNAKLELVTSFVQADAIFKFDENYETDSNKEFSNAFLSLLPDVSEKKLENNHWENQTSL